MVVVYGIVICVMCPCWHVLVMPVLPVAFIVLLLVVFFDMWLAVPTVMLMVVMVMMVVAVMMVVVMAPVVIANLLLIFFLLLLPLLGWVPAGKPLAIFPARLYFHATGCLAVLRVAVVLCPAVVVVMVMVVGVLGSLWFSPQEPLFLFSLTLLSPLLLSLG